MIMAESFLDSIKNNMGHVERLAQPLHIQRLERYLNPNPLLNEVERIFNRGNEFETERELRRLATTVEERRSDKLRLYNFANVHGSRSGLRDVLLSDSSSDDDFQADDNPITEEHFQQMLRDHLREKKLRQKFYSHPHNRQYQYYGAGLLSNYDKFPEHQQSVMGIVKTEGVPPIEQKESRVIDGSRSSKKLRKLPKKESSDDGDFEDRLLVDEDEEDYEKLKSNIGKVTKGNRRKSDKAKSPEFMAMRRRKLWALMAKKDLGKAQRIKSNNHKEMLTARKKVAQLCTKHWKQKALQSQKNMKEIIWRNKRLAREMQVYWKRYERVERDARRRQEKEAEEQRKHNVEFMEAKRQQRKLNFLITQTELFAHFYSKKAGAAGDDDATNRILSQLDEEANPRLLAMDDDYDSVTMKQRATEHAEAAIKADLQRSSEFNVRNASAPLPINSDLTTQPALFKGQLKHYQLKGVNWLTNLYDQGINGILADEMGLGKTVQSIAFLCQIAEKYSVWGPFLIISPASTLHNWQQEMQRFVPDFKVVPYWGNVHERKILRQFWEQKNLHTRDASFHVVITSYQLVIADFKYFNRIKWQYLILDEAQAIKSSNSMRWKLLLGFSCRNRLLLSGTPIQNSMAELWALLHFIMPTLFDNHDEFNEWFSKDIESQAENKSKMDEKHLSRLHMILKPFMLRRIKKDVENELSDKIEIMVYCPLTLRQKLLYSGLKKKIRIEDLLAGISGRAGAPGEEPGKNVTSRLMNLVMQFRKVCNHPELFERREPKSPFFICCKPYMIPKLVFKDGFLYRAIPSNRHIIFNALCAFSVANIQKSFSFFRLLGLSSQEVHNFFLCGILYFLMSLSSWREKEYLIYNNFLWQSGGKTKYPLLLLPTFPLSYPSLQQSFLLRKLVFTRRVNSSFYSFTKHTYFSMPETLEHRIMRSRKLNSNESLNGTKSKPEDIQKSPEEVRLLKKSGKSPKNSPTKSTALSSSPPIEEKSDSFVILPEFPYIERPPRVEFDEATDMPAFLFSPILRVQSRSRELYASCRDCAWERTKHCLCGSADGFHTVWYGHPKLVESQRTNCFYPSPVGGLVTAKPFFGWSNIVIPDKHTLVADAGKLFVLDGLLKRLKEEGHRVLIYSQMTRMIDLLEEYMWHRKHTYMRLDGSSKISERRDMVADFQSRADIFVFLLSTRAGGLGINLTAADTVIFYDSDWNPTVDQQAMDRAHRLGQTKQVTVYRLICKGTIEERILQRAREKSEIQRMVISGGNFKPDHLKPKEVVSLLLDDEEMEKKYIQKQAEKKISDEQVYDKKRKNQDVHVVVKKTRLDEIEGAAAVVATTTTSTNVVTADDAVDLNMTAQSPSRSDFSAPQDDASNDGLVIDVDVPLGFPSTALNSSPLNPLGIGSLRVKPVVRGTRRGRPPGSRRAGINPLRTRSSDSSVVKVPSEMLFSGESGTLPPEGNYQRGIKRGPGRPRMKPLGPGERGSRMVSRPRRAPAPLQVPLARSTTTSTSSGGGDPARSYGFYGSLDS